MQRLERMSLTLRCLGNEYHTVDAIKVSETWAVHKTIFSGNEGSYLSDSLYTVTHIPTGLATTRKLFDFRAAVRMARDFARLPSPEPYVTTHDDNTHTTQPGYDKLVRRYARVRDKYADYIS